ncbi:MAG: hypothetical protein CM1200mP2_04710 [Planctomycetaceae bacterium]|nr:MAG: hypothetical protein CM1200mP2_04710 [Planctomycetaceae bacterium]
MSPRTGKHHVNPSTGPQTRRRSPVPVEIQSGRPPLFLRWPPAGNRPRRRSSSSATEVRRREIPRGGKLQYSTASFACSAVSTCGTIIVLAPMSRAFLIQLDSRPGTRIIGDTPACRQMIGRPANLVWPVSAVFEIDPEKNLGPVSTESLASISEQSSRPTPQATLPSDSRCLTGLMNSVKGSSLPRCRSGLTRGPGVVAGVDWAGAVSASFDVPRRNPWPAPSISASAPANSDSRPRGPGPPVPRLRLLPRPRLFPVVGRAPDRSLFRRLASPTWLETTRSKVAPQIEKLTTRGRRPGLSTATADGVKIGNQRKDFRHDE